MRLNRSINRKREMKNGNKSKTWKTVRRNGRTKTTEDLRRPSFDYGIFLRRIFQLNICLNKTPFSVFITWRSRQKNWNKRWFMFVSGAALRAMLSSCQLDNTTQYTPIFDRKNTGTLYAKITVLVFFPHFWLRLADAIQTNRIITMPILLQVNILLV